MQGWEPGHVVAERYRLEVLIGAGGMGQVWRAEHIKLRSPVAIKGLPPAVAADETRSARFMREAQAAAAIRSTNVVQVLDYGVDSGVAYIAMEYLEGESLEARLARRGRLTPPETLRILTQVARAVGRAHKKGIIHRDLKPGNIFIAREDEGEVVKVLDFGIAKLTTGHAPPRFDTGGGPGDTAADNNTTQAGYLLGTPNYMSPEQARGHKVVDHRTDLWALGVVAFECITGEHPVEGATIGDLIYKICSVDMPRPSKVCPVPIGFDAWFAKCTRREQDERYQTARQLARGLREALTGEPGSGDEDEKQGPFENVEAVAQRASLEMLDTLAAKRQSDKPRDSAESWDTSDEIAMPAEGDLPTLVTPPPPSSSRAAASAVETGAQETESLRVAGAMSRTATNSGPPSPRGRWLLVGSIAAAVVVTAIVLAQQDWDAPPAPPVASPPPEPAPQAQAAPVPSPPLPSPPLPSPPVPSPPVPSPDAPAQPPAVATSDPVPSASAGASVQPRTKAPPRPATPPSGSGKIDFGI